MQELLRLVTIVLVGDNAQLPPVCKCRRFKPCSDDEQEELKLCSTCHLSSSPLWSYANVTRLTAVSYRLRGDRIWLCFLNLCRARAPTQEEVDAVLPPRRHALSVEAVKSIVTADDTLLVTHRRDREEWNRHVLMKAFGGTPGAVVDVCVVVTPFGLDQGSLAAFFERNKYWMELESVAIDALVMVTENAPSSRNGEVNGNVGRVVSIAYKNQKVNVIRVQFADLRIASVRRTKTRRTNAGGGGRSYTLATFPLKYCAYGGSARRPGKNQHVHHLSGRRQRRRCPGQRINPVQ